MLFSFPKAFYYYLRLVSLDSIVIATSFMRFHILFAASNASVLLLPFLLIAPSSSIFYSLFSLFFCISYVQIYHPSPKLIHICALYYCEDMSQWLNDRPATSPSRFRFPATIACGVTYWKTPLSAPRSGWTLKLGMLLKPIRSIFQDRTPDARVLCS